MRKLAIIGAVVTTLLVGPIHEAQADSGRLHLHLDVGAGVPLTGPTRRQSTGDSAAGGGGWLSLDYQFAPPIAVELIFGVAGFGRPFPRTARTGSRFGHFGAGLRLRLLDDQDGYNNEEDGNLPSNLWVSLHVGYANFDKAQFAVDAAIGYEISVIRPLQLGLFARSALMFGGTNDGVDMIFIAGISIGIEILGEARADDRDGDGLSDEREAELGTDPTDEDTDGDLIHDGVEVETNTNPLERDTDYDGLNDGREDTNHNGVLDAGETDPRRSDTDGGGMPDPDEVRSSNQDPRYAEDDDRDEDGVADHVDGCPNSPDGATVDASGCVPQQQTMTLDGVRFRTGSARILPESESTLREALETLRRQPDQRFEIAGHTDSQGREASNRRLSEQRARAVLRWLVEHGLDASRFEVRGYGSSEPVDSNDTPEGRTRNRRIEFRRAD